MTYLNYEEKRIKNIIYRLDNLIINSNENINGVGIGRKIINGKESNIPCLTIFVKNKISRYLLSKDKFIPRYINGVSTDIVELDSVGLYGLIRNNPAYGGCNIIVSDGNEGTLAYPVIKRNDVGNIYFLSSAHVLGKVGNTVKYIPSSQVGELFLGTVTNIIYIKNSITINNYNIVDAGIGIVGDYNKHISNVIASELLNAIKIKGVENNLSIGTTVYKIGRSTGLTEGRITNLDCSFLVKENTIKRVIFKRQIRAALESSEGDSGALGVVKDNNKAFGLLLGGATSDKKGQYTVFNPIKDVLHELGVELLI